MILAPLAIYEPGPTISPFSSAPARELKININGIEFYTLKKLPARFSFLYRSIIVEEECELMDSDCEQISPTLGFVRSHILERDQKDGDVEFWQIYVCWFKVSKPRVRLLMHGSRST